MTPKDPNALGIKPSTKTHTHVAKRHTWALGLGLSQTTQGAPLPQASPVGTTRTNCCQIRTWFEGLGKALMYLESHDNRNI